MALTHAAITAFVLTADRTRAVAFYRDVLGLAVLEEDEFAVAFTLGGGATLRLTSLAGHVPSEHPSLGWEVEDIAATLAELRAAGVAPLIYEGFGQDADGVWTAPDGRVRLAWIADPDGNVLGLSQR